MDFIKQGVRVNAICPGTIESPSFRDRVAAHGQRAGKSAKAALQDFIDRQPMGRIGLAEEVAMLAVYLASDESAFISGHTPPDRRRLGAVSTGQIICTSSSPARPA